MSDEMLRADVLLCERGLASSRERARALIDAGLAFADSSRIDKPARRLRADCALEVRGEVCPYVSRGGFKLAKALDVFQLDVTGAVVIDVGASTGGFTDVLLRRGARRVYAVDVGTAQLDAALSADPRVVSMERINARTLTRALFPEPPSLGVMDVSFISIRKILPALREVLGDAGRLISLVKPQFEAGRAALGKGGVVTSSSAHERVLRELVAEAPELGWHVRALDFSPICGGDGNIEFLADLGPDTAPSPGPDAIRALVRRAHAQLRSK